MEKQIRLGKKLVDVLNRSRDYAIKNGFLMLTPEHVVLTLTCNKAFADAYTESGGDIVALKNNIKHYLKENLDVNPDKNDVIEPVRSAQFQDIMNEGLFAAVVNQSDEASVAHLLLGLMSLRDSFAKYYVYNNIDQKTLIDNVCKYMKCPPITIYNMIDEQPDFMKLIDDIRNNEKQHKENKNRPPSPLDILIPMGMGQMGRQKPEDWKELVTCLNDAVEENYTPLIGREKELSEVCVALLRKEKSNPVLTGEAGVGKTAIVKGLAKLINDGNVPEKLKDYKIYEVNVSGLVSGSKFRGDFEEKMLAIFEGASEEKAILCIDEIHTICGAGGSGSSDAAQMLKPFLTSGKVKVIGATTTSEYAKCIEKDAALDRRFSPVNVPEPSKEDTIEIIQGIKSYYEDFHKVLYPDEIITAIVNLTTKFMRDKFLPDKAIDILDLSGAYVESNRDKFESPVITIDIVEEVLANKCNIPRNSVSADESKEILTLEDTIKEKVVGQDKAIKTIYDKIILSRMGLRGKDKPVANLLFVGPTGVGKTYLAQTLADSLHIPLIRKNMSEYMEPHSVAKLFGSPAGYVGNEDGGQLVNEIRKNPHCVLLIDEIEKAHPDVFNVFLQIMDDANLTDGLGRNADFRNVILIMTSNAGAADAEKAGIGFNASETTPEAMTKAVNHLFKAEFRNRLDAIVEFAAMDKEMARKITCNQMKELCDTLMAEHEISLGFTDKCIDAIVDKGFDKKYGARNIKRTIESDVTLQIAKKILTGSLVKGEYCNVDYNGEFIIS